MCQALYENGAKPFCVTFSLCFPSVVFLFLVYISTYIFDLLFLYNIFLYLINRRQKVKDSLAYDSYVSANKIPIIKHLLNLIIITM